MLYKSKYFSRVRPNCEASVIAYRCIWSLSLLTCTQDLDLQRKNKLKGFRGKKKKEKEINPFEGKTHFRPTALSFCDISVLLTQRGSITIGRRRPGCWRGHAFRRAVIVVHD